MGMKRQIRTIFHNPAVESGRTLWFEASLFHLGLHVIIPEVHFIDSKMVSVI